VRGKGRSSRLKVGQKWLTLSEGADALENLRRWS